MFDEFHCIGLQFLDLLGLALLLRVHLHFLDEANIFLEELLVLGGVLDQFLDDIQRLLIKYQHLKSRSLQL